MKPTLWNIFKVFTGIGAFTIGGGYMMVPAVEAAIRKRGWIPEEELPDIVALSQSAPGLLAANMAIFTGFRLRGVKGSIVATIGTMLAPVAIILAIAMFFASFKDSPAVEAIFAGVRPVAVAIIAGYGIKLLKNNGRWWQWAISTGTLAAIAVLKISAVYVLLTTIVLAYAIAKYRKRNLHSPARSDNKNRHQQ